MALPAASDPSQRHGARASSGYHGRPLSPVDPIPSPHLTPNPPLPPRATEEPASDLRSFLSVLWRGKWILLLCVLGLPLAIYLYSAQLENTYESSTDLQVQAQSVDTSLFTTETVAPERTLAAAARLVRTTAVAEEASREIDDPPRNPRALLDQITVTPDEASGFLTITASAPQAQRAADIANAFASAVVVTRARSARDRIDRTISELQSNLDNLSRSDPNGRRQLSQQLQRLRALRAAQGNNAQVVEPAVAAGSPVAPNPIRNTLLGVILALLLGIGLVVLRHRLDRKLRSAEQLEQLAGVPLLGTLPASAFPAHKSSPDVPEAFQYLRASLTYFNIDRELTSVLVTSPVKGDGKTTVAINLAISFARSGRDVILLDADMRNAQVAKRLDLTTLETLATVLIGKANLTDALVDADIEPGRLRVLPGGPVPPNPSELIGSKRMRGLLADLTEMSDIVLIDTPPVLVVSDVIPLLEQVSGILVVAQLGKTNSEAVSRLATVVRTARGSLLGVAATGARGGSLYGAYAYVSSNGGQPAVGSDNSHKGETRRRSGLRGRLSRRS